MSLQSNSLEPATPCYIRPWQDSQCRALIFASRLREAVAREVYFAIAGVNFTAWRAVQHGETTRDPVNSLVSRCIDPSERLLRVAKGSRVTVRGRRMGQRRRVNVP